MGNAFSSEGLEGGRQQAVTEIKRRHRALPPNSVRSSAEDWPYIEVRGGRGHVWLHLLMSQLPEHTLPKNKYRRTAPLQPAQPR